MLPNHHVYSKLARLNGAFKIIAIPFSAVYYRVSLEWYQIICVGSFSFVKSQKALSKVWTSQDHPAKRTSADMELRNYPKPKHLSS